LATVIKGVPGGRSSNALIKISRLWIVVLVRNSEIIFSKYHQTFEKPKPVDTHENFRANRHNTKLHGRTQIPETGRVPEPVHHPVGIVGWRHFQHNLETRLKNQMR
jgi:hypothetical protein